MAALFAACPSHGDSATVAPMQIKQSGFLGIDEGEIVHGIENDNNASGSGAEIYKSWQERMLFDYDDDVNVTDRIHFALAMECQLSFTYPYDMTAIWETHQPQITVYPDRAEATYTLGDLNKPYLQFGFGYFPFRTDPDVKDLGEYLFRTNTYPVYAINNFNRPYTRLLGFRASSTLPFEFQLNGFPLFENLHQDLLLTSSDILPPLVNMTLSYLVSFKLAHCLEIGGGVSFCNFIQANSSLVTPQNPSTQYIEQNGDTAYYTFAATKPMARFAFDPKPLLGLNIFGKQDLRLYGEACVTGWKDYKNYDTSFNAIPSYYENRGDRTLYMMGFNFPAFKALDVLSLELEHFPNKYPNSGYYLFGMTETPIPQPSLNPSSGQQVYPWFWAIYAKKTFLKKFSFIVQFARDHMRPINNNLNYQYTEDVLERKGDWWWDARLCLNY
jgi:hypothetical protein